MSENHRSFTLKEFSLFSPVVKMKKVEWKYCFYFLLIVFLGKTQLVNSEVSKKTSTEYLYRIINWCIVGKGEFELYEWPFLQFRTFLREDHKVRSYEDNFRNRDALKTIYPKPNLNLEFKSIICEGEWPAERAAGAPKDFFPAPLEAEPPNYIPYKKLIGRGVNGEYLQRAHVQFISTLKIEGLILQGVHAPFGLGFPFGQFAETSEFDCTDCTQMKSIVIGCISRPGGELMPPTVGAFHHKYKHPTTTPKKVGKLSEIHWNFKWADNKCSSVRAVEFWALVVLSFEERVWYTHKFGPYDFETRDSNKILNEPKTANIGQPGIPSVIMPRCNKRLRPIPLPMLPNCENIVETNPKEVCEDEMKYIKYALKPLPSQIKCHNDDYGFLSAGTVPDGVNIKDPAVDKSKEWSKIRFAGSFDVDCIQKFNASKDVKYPYKVCPKWQNKYACLGTPEDIAIFQPQPHPGNSSKKRLFPESHCNPCVTMKPTPPPDDIDDSDGWIKRKPHTILMIFAFFFVLPLSAFIGRFYKETLHTCEFKGWRLWLMIHSGTSIVTQVLCYASYSLVTFPNDKTQWDAHIWTGYAAVFCCAGGFFSGWARHKEFHLKWVLIISHLACGYSSYGLALTSYATHKKVGEYSSMAAYFSFSLSILAMLFMTVHIFIVDKKLGVTPKRFQFPIITIRFDDVYPPGHRVRLIFLGIYSFALFLACGAMIFIE